MYPWGDKRTGPLGSLGLVVQLKNKCQLHSNIVVRLYDCLYLLSLICFIKKYQL